MDNIQLAPSHLAQRPENAELASRAQASAMTAMVAAKNSPRNTIKAEERILEACKRKGLAEEAQYTYPRGGKKVQGASIRLAEAMAQNWGNMECGVTELEQRDGESTVQTYAWDLETNTRITKTFSVKHIRTKSEGYGADKKLVSSKLDDPRDIYEMVANQGARRLRACILAVIPGDIQDSAIAACNATLAGDTSEPIQDRAKKMVKTFNAMGVTQEHIEEYLGHNLDAVLEMDLVTLRGVYRSINDGMSKPSDHFNIPEKKSKKKAATLKEGTSDGKGNDAGDVANMVP